jgi:hypothetical protein
MLQEIFSFLNGHAGILAVLTLLGSAFRYFHLQTREANQRQFEEYHKFMKQLVVGDEGAVGPHPERQLAVIFELRNFPRYYPITVRILTNLKNLWAFRTTLPQSDPLYLDQKIFLNMQREIYLTISFIKNKRRWIFFKCFKDEKI